MRSGNVWNVKSVPWLCTNTIFHELQCNTWESSCQMFCYWESPSTFVWSVGEAILQEIAQCLGLALPDYICTVFTFLNNFFSQIICLQLHSSMGETFISSWVIAIIQQGVTCKLQIHMNNRMVEQSRTVSKNSRCWGFFSQPTWQKPVDESVWKVHYWIWCRRIIGRN